MNGVNSSLVRCDVSLAYSINDPAGKGIAEVLRELTDARPIQAPYAVEAWILPAFNALLAGFAEDVIYLEFLDKVTECGFHLILSRHSSEAGVKSLTVHHPGNPVKEAKAGGRPLELPPSNPHYTKALLLNLFNSKDRLKDFKVTYEVTHHGPSSLCRPVTFVEIGSSENEWLLKEAHEVVAEAVIETLVRQPPRCEPTVGIGGNHYAGLFTERALSTSEAYGHVIAKYALRDLENPTLVEKVVELAVSRSSVITKKLVVEKKLRKAWREAAEKVAEKHTLELTYV